jgi:hypothetical protein
MITRNPQDSRTRVITSPNDLEKTTSYRETDCRTALARGLREYIEDNHSIQWAAGKEVSFLNVLEIWGAPEFPAKFPSCVVNGAGDGTYVGNQLNPSLVECSDIPGTYVRVRGDFEQTFDLIVWATDDVARMALTSHLESLLNPVDWMDGLRLELPFFFGARATYIATSPVYQDAEDSSSRKLRVGLIRVIANVGDILPDVARPNVKVRRDILVNGMP